MFDDKIPCSNCNALGEISHRETHTDCHGLGCSQCENGETVQRVTCPICQGSRYCDPDQTVFDTIANPNRQGILDVRPRPSSIPLEHIGRYTGPLLGIEEEQTHPLPQTKQGQQRNTIMAVAIIAVLFAIFVTLLIFKNMLSQSAEAVTVGATATPYLIVDITPNVTPEWTVTATATEIPSNNKISNETPIVKNTPAAKPTDTKAVPTATPTSAPPLEINDSVLPASSYVGSGWFYHSPRDNGNYGNDAHLTNGNGDFFTYTCDNCRGFAVISEQAAFVGNMYYNIDGTQVAVTNDSCGCATVGNQKVFDVSSYPLGKHTLTITKDNDGTYLIIDALILNF